jgi:hypothetical protein
MEGGDEGIDTNIRRSEVAAHGRKNADFNMNAKRRTRVRWEGKTQAPKQRRKDEQPDAMAPMEDIGCRAAAGPFLRRKRKQRWACSSVGEEVLLYVCSRQNH